MRNYYFQFWPSVQEMLFKDFSIFSCVGHFFGWHRTTSGILVVGLGRIICVKSF